MWKSMNMRGSVTGRSQVSMMSPAPPYLTTRSPWSQAPATKAEAM